MAEILSQEFGRVAISNLRFWEKVGLVHPKRTPGGHRLYDEQDLALLRRIKALQKSYFPLQVIRELLLEKEETKHKALIVDKVLRPLAYREGFKPLSREEMAQTSGLTLSEVERLQEIGLIGVIPEKMQGGYDEDDLRIAQAVKALADLGVRVEDLSFYHRFIEQMVRHETKLGLRRMVGRKDVGHREAVQQAITVGLEKMAELRSFLHAKFMKREAMKLGQLIEKQEQP
ncbi:MAG: MerR family transcriptional regulator [Chloroflexi bacterium]|nr:MerR family transcriptional regulator [Chloroflexota bacterium]